MIRATVHAMLASTVACPMDKLTRIGHLLFCIMSLLVVYYGFTCYQSPVQEGHLQLYIELVVQ